MMLRNKGEERKRFMYPAHYLQRISLQSCASDLTIWAGGDEHVAAFLRI
jgi:hypothetical protein